MASTAQSRHAPADAAAVRAFERELELLAQSRSFGKAVHQTRILGHARKLIQSAQGVAALYARSPRFDDAGLFAGGDWDDPKSLQPGLVRETLGRADINTTLECLNQLRFLALAQGEATHADVRADQARAYLDDVLAQNLDYVFPEATEATRESGAGTRSVEQVLTFVASRLGSAGIVGALVTECERVLLQRPIMVQRVEAMLRAAARALPLSEDIAPDDEERARLLLDALDGPTQRARSDADPEGYGTQLEVLDREALEDEASAFGRTMDQTGLVCPLHATLLRHVATVAPELLPHALALDHVGRTSLEEHLPTVQAVIDRAVVPETARCIYGLSRLLNRGILFFNPVPPGLLRLAVLPIAPDVAEELARASSLDDPPDANTLLLAGALQVIGQPRGVDQGHNPTCQAARAISLWSHNDAGYLLELIAHAARDDEIIMHFEGAAIHSGDLTFGLAQELHTELDPVSLVLTPHLDKVYMEMSRRTIGRDEDGHKWVNPEFHGWWVSRGFAALVDAHSGAIQDFEGFVRTFYAAYHPEHNGGRELVYAQPCGVVSTNPDGAFIGWHAVSIERVAQDPQGTWRVYFFNPNRDKGQDWGDGIVTSTCDHGEWEGESSLPVEQFAMRLYVFHYKSRELGDPDSVPGEHVETVRAAIAAGWAADRAWEDA